MLSTVVHEATTRSSGPSKRNWNVGSHAHLKSPVKVLHKSLVGLKCRSSTVLYSTQKSAVMGLWIQSQNGRRSLTQSTR
ncbi:hypothetical protein D915_010302 [Fasciola hepatica]|uniref:Uncharacterized protein n=1 Tax=Fasciola hepatica TaxID=6192 RepID=A0A4E0QZF2_FASHE|nr:hypothetical protein D915_010302 [Fasciola hepatica]